MSSFMLNIPSHYQGKMIEYNEPVFLIGSCFTEHIGNALANYKFPVLQNPNGILFDPASTVHALKSYIKPTLYTEKDIFYLNDVWQSWYHHSRFSALTPEACLNKMNQSQEEAHRFLKTAKWLIITLGSSFSYRLTNQAAATGGGAGLGVANCHRAPQQWFDKHMMTIEETVTSLDNMLHQLFFFNPGIQVIFTVSPVRHIRDGVVANNRSKARLLESVHHLVNKFDRLHYFAAYELVIDVLRDYRFFDVDMVHPNYAATNFVLENFMKEFVSGEANQIAEHVQKLVTAAKHRPMHEGTNAHQVFLKTQAEKARQLMKEYPFLDFSKELDHFLKGKL
ncbi:GSCFA domain-containing protein [Gynurincola endophyticus]|uniref:GSCFA domain-containing protein n=1 Tax=Gynurincola endophyticus TaxID=2479004 RepID=UPI001F1FDA5E|nr:GSCFA domain-containing protein [Gynurincola endophyticus]